MAAKQQAEERELQLLEEESQQHRVASNLKEARFGDGKPCFWDVFG